MFPKTLRGFSIYGEMTDGYRNDITVQESSSIHGGVWIFCNDPHTDRPRIDHLGMEDRTASPHLTSREQIDELIDYLTTARDDVFPSQEPDTEGGE